MKAVLCRPSTHSHIRDLIGHISSNEEVVDFSELLELPAAAQREALNFTDKVAATLCSKVFKKLFKSLISTRS